MEIDLQEDSILAGCTRIMVMGVGGGGCNSINRMIDGGVKGVEFVAINTDKQALAKSKAPKKIVIGEKLTGGRGAGSVPNIGEKAAIESSEMIKNQLKDVNMLFIAAGMGGGTGTGASPIIAKIAREMNILTISVVTKPFDFEKKSKIAEEGINKLVEYSDTILTISNQALFNTDEDTPLIEMWRRIDDVLKNGVQGISDLIVSAGEINIDFADVETVMKNRGQALMGIGYGKGDSGAEDAVNMAIQNPFMPDLIVSNATAMLVNIAGSSKMPFKQFKNTMSYIEGIVSEDAKVKMGQTFDDTLQDSIKVTLVATGFSSVKKNKEHNQYDDDEDKDKKKEAQGNIYTHSDFFDLLQKTSRDSHINVDEPAIFRKIKKQENNNN